MNDSHDDDERENADEGDHAGLAGRFGWADSEDGSPESAATEADGAEHFFGHVDPTDDVVHGRLMAPDEGGNDDVAELVATEYPVDDPLAPEESALHIEEH